MTKHKKEPEDWMQKKWRPAMGWMYMGVCIFDFVLFPVFWSLLQSIFHGQVASQWQPLTLQGAGLFHLAMGAVLGIAAHGRTQEKINGAESGGMQFPANAGTTYVPPGSQNTVNVSNQPNNNFGGNNGGFNSPTSSSTTFSSPSSAGFNSPSNFSTPASNPGFNSPATNTGFGSPTTATSGFGDPGQPVVNPATTTVVRKPIIKPIINN
jgi:hypothetical protein